MSKPEDSVIFSSQLVIHPVKVLVCDQPGLGDDIVLVTKVDTILYNEQFFKFSYLKSFFDVYHLYLSPNRHL